jgi:pheromone shutdown-related protein TraB
MQSSSFVTCVEHDGKEITIVGTAHVSHRSVDEVRRVIAELKPDTVCVELDRGRHESLVDDKRYRRLDLFQIIKQKRVPFLLANLALSAYQKKIGDKIGIRPGAELLAAVHSCEAVGAQLVLADRDIQATLKRTWSSISFWNKLRLSMSLLAAPFAVEDINEEQIEKLKERDTISDMLSELSKLVPGLKGPLIDERDAYLASSVRAAPGRKIVAVVGAGHVQGILANLDQPVDRERLEQLPRPSTLGRVLGWAIPILVLGSFYFGGWRSHSTETLLHMLLAWVIPTSLGCALFTAFAGAHPLTILSGILAAPITTLNPLIGAGMVTALVQAWVRRPNVADCEAIPQSITSLRGWYNNPATRVLLVFLLSSLGASIGMLIGTTWVVSLL